MKKKEKSSSIFVVGEKIYNVKFNMDAQTWLLNHYWLFLLEYFLFLPGGPWYKILCRPYAYDFHNELGKVSKFGTSWPKEKYIKE